MGIVLVRGIISGILKFLNREEKAERRKREKDIERLKGKNRKVGQGWRPFYSNPPVALISRDLGRVCESH